MNYDFIKKGLLKHRNSLIGSYKIRRRVHKKGEIGDQVFCVGGIEQAVCEEYGRLRPERKQGA